MKKNFVLAAIIVFALATCDDGSGSDEPLETDNTTLKIKNESFSEITDVIWQNISFANSQSENSIKTGTTVTNDVTAGSGYIFFKRKSNPVIARTRDLVVVNEKENIEFLFIDNTLIVEVNNTSNTGTLRNLQSTVVWWDDAESEMQPYFVKQSFVGYYAVTSSDLLFNENTTLLYNDCYPPKNGNKSIAIGGTNTALLHLRVNLSKHAKLSFWYANRDDTSTTTPDGAAFSINGEKKWEWNSRIDWSFVEYDLQPGENNLIWEKKDGQFVPTVNDRYSYLSLDDILIYYTE